MGRTLAEKVWEQPLFNGSASNPAETLEARGTMHSIAAMIGRAEGLAQRVVELTNGAAVVVPAPQGFVIVPVTEEFSAALPARAPACFPDAVTCEFLTESVAALAEDLSADTDIAYVETEYFGGVGGQSAMVWRQGAIVLGPLYSRTTGPESPEQVLSGAINRALRYLGVQAESFDEFEAIGFASVRSTKEWLGTDFDDDDY